MQPINIAEVNQNVDTSSQNRSATSAIIEGVVRFVMGTAAGMVGALAVYPIDMAKTRLQNQKSTGNFASQKLYNNFWDVWKHIFKHEGFFALYKGLGPQMIGVGPEKAIKLVVNDTVRDIFRTDGEVPEWAALVAGATAGGCQVVVTNPLEIIKIRMQVASETGQSTSIMKEFNSLGTNFGNRFWGLYKGASACFARDIPFSFIYFPTYSALKQGALRSSWAVNEDGSLNTLGILGPGTMAGAPAAYLTTPFDVIKTRLQVKTKEGELAYKGLMDCGRRIVQEEGFPALFKGGMMRIFRSAPQFGVTLLTYEKLQSYFNPAAYFGGSQPIGSHKSVHSIHISQLPALNQNHVGGYKIAAATYAGMENKFGLHLPR